MTDKTKAIKTLCALMTGLLITSNSLAIDVRIDDRLKNYKTSAKTTSSKLSMLNNKYICQHYYSIDGIKWDVFEGYLVQKFNEDGVAVHVKKPLFYGFDNDDDGKIVEYEMYGDIKQDGLNGNEQNYFKMIHRR